MANKYKNYEQSDAVKQAYEKLQEQQTGKPASYQSGFQSQLDGIMDKIKNRGKFSYDPTGDALYQQYKNQYLHGGKLAMQDTMGQASALTGGYGNSYAQQAGQQAYQGYLNGLNDKLPDLYNMAMQKYQMEGSDLKDQYSMLAQRENQDYGRYQDAYNMWMQGVTNAQNRYDTERQFDYSKYADSLAYQYKTDRDAVSDAQWQANYDEARRQYEMDMAYRKDRDAVSDAQWKTEYDENKRRYDQEWDYQMSKANSGGWGGSSGNTASSNTELESFLKKINGYVLDGDRGGFMSDLSYLVATGKITNQEADVIADKWFPDYTSENEPRAETEEHKKGKNITTRG